MGWEYDFGEISVKSSTIGRFNLVTSADLDQLCGQSELCYSWQDISSVM